MFLLLSPAKSQNFDEPSPVASYTTPLLQDEIASLINILRDYNPDKIASLMGVSDKLAQLNFERFQTFDPENFTFENAKQAVFAFQGDVYRGLQADSLSVDDLQFAQKHLGVISGLYGLLRPLDLIQPYRLEMKTRLENSRGKDLYHFWGELITQEINQALSQSDNPIVINLASDEYFKAVKPKLLTAEVLKVDFKEFKNDTYKIVGIYAKYARGLMARYVITHQIEDVTDLKNFKEEGYEFSKDQSTASHYVFTRG